MSDDGRWRAIRLEDVERVPWRDSDLVWRPLRAALGSPVVGMAAYTAERAGQDVVEDHVEAADGRGHHEVYAVLAGRATFTLDGERLDAPAGTFVAVPPAVRRHAAAAEPGTVVLALGGPATFEPSASEWIERARPHLRSDPARARDVLDDLRRRRPDSAGLRFGEALLAAAGGHEDAARDWLRAAVEREPGLRDEAAREPLLRHLAAALG
jgi:mannose-6-phosphate isomerase-like protein (cupin superfamily)